MHKWLQGNLESANIPKADVAKSLLFEEWENISDSSVENYLFEESEDISDSSDEDYLPPIEDLSLADDDTNIETDDDIPEEADDVWDKGLWY